MNKQEKNVFMKQSLFQEKFKTNRSETGRFFFSQIIRDLKKAQKLNIHGVCPMIPFFYAFT